MNDKNNFQDCVKIAFQPFIPQISLSTYYMPGTVLDAENKDGDFAFSHSKQKNKILYVRMCSESVRKGLGRDHETERGRGIMGMLFSM